MQQSIWMEISSLIKKAVVDVTGSPLLADLTTTIIGVIGILSLILAFCTILVWMERKVCGIMQMRYGPNRVGPFGIFQSIADTIKLITKEDIVPAQVSYKMWAIAPILLFTAAMTTYAVIPFDNGLVLADMNVGMLIFFAIGSQGTLALLMASWSSKNKLALIGGMRSVAQMISYEIPLVFAVLGVVMITGSMKLSDIVKAQEGLWFIVTQPVAFVIYMIAATAECNRTPFDLVECESELVAGPYTEYSGMRFAYFFMSEYTSLVVASCVATTVFLGGWHGPLLPGWIWFFIKVFAMIFVFMWFRWTFPRLRVDQLMSFSWRILLPLALANIIVTGVGLWLFCPLG